MCDCFLKINIAKDSTVTVSWDITAVDGFSQEDIGPQIGKGELAGNIKDGQIWINMNPRIADYNIFLNGYYSNDGLHGRKTISGDIVLKRRLQEFEVQFFERGGQESLDVKWKGLKFEWQEIPAFKFYTTIH